MRRSTEGGWRRRWRQSALAAPAAPLSGSSSGLTCPLSSALHLCSRAGGADKGGACRGRHKHKEQCVQGEHLHAPQDEEAVRG